MPLITFDTSGLSDIQKKVIAWGLGITTIFGGGFFGGVKFCDIKIKLQIGKYQIEIDKLAKQVNDRDASIQNALKDRDDHMYAARLAKQQAEQAGAAADAAEQRYRALTKDIPFVPTNELINLSRVQNAVIASPVLTITPGEVRDACDTVIANKNLQITGLNTSLTNCFDAKAAADRAIVDLQSNQRDLITEVDLKGRINNDLNKELESQKRRKWLYLIGGVITGVAVDRAIKK